MKTEEDFLREDHRVVLEEMMEEMEETAGITAAVTAVSEMDRTAEADVRVEERAAVPEIWRLHRSLLRLPRTVRESATEKTRIKRKILRRIRVAEEDQTLSLIHISEPTRPY